MAAFFQRRRPIKYVLVMDTLVPSEVCRLLSPEYLAVKSKWYCGITVACTCSDQFFCTEVSLMICARELMDIRVRTIKNGVFICWLLFSGRKIINADELLPLGSMNLCNADAENGHFHKNKM